jgi:hypothetical protein
LTRGIRLGGVVEEIVGQDGPELRRTIVSETLAFGWIDGEGDSIDGDRTMRYFSSRKREYELTALCKRRLPVRHNWRRSFFCNRGDRQTVGEPCRGVLGQLP